MCGYGWSLLQILFGIGKGQKTNITWKYNVVRYQVFTAVCIHIIVFWHVTQCDTLNMHMDMVLERSKRIKMSQNEVFMDYKKNEQVLQSQTSAINNFWRQNTMTKTVEIKGTIVWVDITQMENRLI